MSEYQKIIYGSYPKSHYPSQLAEKLFKDYLCTYGQGSRLLDVGCGSGQFVHEFSHLGFRAEGIDCNGIYKVLETTHSNIDFNTDRLPYPDNSFDIVFTKSVVEHVRQTEHLLGEIYRVLRPHGLLIVLTPAWEFNYRWFYDDPTHVKPFHRKGLQDALRLAGFSDVVTKYFYHLPIFWKFTWLKIIASLVRLLPDDWRWRDWNQQRMNVFIRFCKEIQLLSTARK